MIRFFVRPTFCFLLFIAILMQCREQEFPSMAYPGLETMSVTRITPDGAMFRAKISRPGQEPVTDHGFVWGLHDNPSPGRDETLSLGEMHGDDVFNASIEHTLIPDTTYFVKAYVTTKKHTVYGKVVSFRSGNGLPPLVEKLVPRKGTKGDTVVIHGRHFSATPSNVGVWFGETEAQVAVSNDSTIRCVVPGEIDGQSVPVTVTVYGQLSDAAVFEFTPPQVDGFSPAKAFFGDTLVITGSGFSLVTEDNKVYFNEYFSRVARATKETLTVVVPPGLGHYAATLTVEVDGRRSTAEKKFVLLPPVLASVSPLKGKRGTLVTVKGERFSGHLAGNQVLFGDNPGKIVTANEHEIRVEVPKGVYDARTMDVTVQVAGQPVVWHQPFLLDEAWIEKHTVPGGFLDHGTAFVIGKSGYAGLGSRDSRTFWRFSPEENAWEEIAGFPGRYRDRATSFVINGKAYVGGGGRGPLLKDFYRYDPSSNRWTAVADFPFGISDAVAVARNGKGYVIARKEDDERNSLWAYDPGANQWTEIAAKGSFSGYAETGFVVNNRLFCIVQDDAANRNVLMEFDFGNLTWQQRNTSGGNLMRDDFVTSIGHNGVGYIFDSSGLQRYDVSTGVLSRVSDAPEGRQASVAFVLNGKLYFGYGHRGNTRMSDFWEWIEF